MEADGKAQPSNTSCWDRSSEAGLGGRGSEGSSSAANTEPRAPLPPPARPAVRTGSQACRCPQRQHGTQGQEGEGSRGGRGGPSAAPGQTRADRGLSLHTVNPRGLLSKEIQCGCVTVLLKRRWRGLRGSQETMCRRPWGARTKPHATLVWSQPGAGLGAPSPSSVPGTSD